MTRDLKSFLEFTIFESGKFKLQVFNILNIVIIFLLAALILWLISKFFKRKRAQGRIDQRKAYALVQVSSYIVYTIAILLAIDSIGIKITVLLAGSTALLVGLGLGLQDFFRDLVAGFIILWERTVTSGDIVEISVLEVKIK